MVEGNLSGSKKMVPSQTTKNNERIKAEIQGVIEIQLKETATKSNKN